VVLPPAGQDHTRPLGLVDFDLTGEAFRPEEYVDQIWQALYLAINDHLIEDGLAEVTRLEPAGLPYRSTPACVKKRELFLKEAPFISLVVCTRDRAAQLANCLSSLLAMEYPWFEINVVDNAPQTSATADLVWARYGHLPHVRYTHEDRPGLSWARNCGLRHARGEIIAFTDDDVEVDSGWLLEIAGAFRATDNVACVTGLTLPAELETQVQAWFEQFGGLNKGRGLTRLLFNLTTHRSADPLYPYLSSKVGAGVNSAFKTSVLRDIAGFDPAFGPGMPTGSADDTEAFFRLIMQGYTVVYEPAALVRHFHRREYARLRQQLKAYGIGLTAHLTKCVVSDLRRGLILIGKLPRALYYLFSPLSPRNMGKRVDYPPELTWVELIGMLYGPVAYLQSCWRKRNIIRQFGPQDLGARLPAAKRRTQGQG
jgi:glycosyltransferase involved in cell wall biosynthesis